MAMQTIVYIPSLCDCYGIHHWLFWVLTRPSAWQCLTTLGPSLSQSCCFCDDHRLYLTSLYTFNCLSGGHAEAESPEEMFHCHTHAQTITIWCLWGYHPKYANTNLSAHSLSHPAVCTCLGRCLLVHKLHAWLLCLCLPRNFYWSELPRG